MMPARFFLSRHGLRRLSALREKLQDDLQRSTKEMGESVKRDNDLRENPEYMQLQTKVSYEIPAKIAETTRILDAYTLIENTQAIREGHFDEVEIGMQVTLEDFDGVPRVISILGYGDGDPINGVVSYLAPVAMALLHKTIGDEVNLPDAGKQVTYEITKIQLSPYLD